MRLHATEMGQGPVLVLLHGLFGAGRNFGAVQRALSARHRVIALDLRNHGQSPHAPGMDYAALANDVAETLAEMQAAPAHVLGHSMGGKVAMRLALDRPSDVASLLVADIAPVAYAGIFARYTAALRALDLAPNLTRQDADAALQAAVPEAAVRGFLLQNLQFAPPRWRLGLEEITAGMPQILAWDAPAQAHFDGPTLFMAGANSDYIQPSMHPAIQALFPNAKFVTLKDAGHWLHADNPKAFLAVVELFLN